MEIRAKCHKYQRTIVYLTSLCVHTLISPHNNTLLLYTGASKQLGTIIEGESLLNDGAAIVLFNVLINELIPGHSQTGKRISFVLSGWGCCWVG